MIEVLPAIMPKSFADLTQKALKVAPFVKSAQIDIMDGYFTSEPSYPFIDGDSNALAHNFSMEARIGFELDMMVENPERYIDEWIAFGISTFIIHFESTQKIEHVIEYVRGKEKGVALAFKPSTKLADIEPYIEHVDFIQCMGNDNIGFQGVSLDARVLEHIRDLRNRYPHCIISCDIGVNFETAPKLREAGVSKLVSGSAIFEADDIKEAIRTLAIA